MRDYAEIVHNLRCCGVGVPCDDCTYQNDMMKCGSLEGQAANAIEELLAAVPKWISVEDALPETDDFVIVAVLDERGDTPYQYIDFGWYLDVARCWIVNAEQRRDITHWMPLPEPPKEAE